MIENTMKISEILQQDKVNLSFEFFPPKKDMPFDSVQEATEIVSKLNPAFFSITYGAAGGATHNTVKVATEVQRNLGVTALAHLTGKTLSREEVGDILSSLTEDGIQNILAIRGDLFPERAHLFKEDFLHASDLIRFIKEQGDFCVGAACYPEGHVESEDKREDIRHLKLKQEAGADFLTSQMFFDNNIFYNFMYRLRDAGVTIPIIAGIMPISAYHQIKTIEKLSGGTYPAPFIAIADKFKHHPVAFETAMLHYTCHQIIDLVANGVNNIHIYTMNKGDTARKIMNYLGEILTA